MKIAILGGGNIAQAAAADLTLNGHTVNLFEHPKFRKNIEAVLKNGGVLTTGEIFGFAKINKVTIEIEEAIKDVDAILIMVPAFGHRAMAEICAPYLEDGATVILDPGSTGGALEFHRVLEEKGVRRKVKIAETTLPPYGCRMTEPGVVKSTRLGRRYLAAFPGEDTQGLISVYKKLYPNVLAATNVMETSLNNPNPVYHVAGAICNAGRIEYVYTQRKQTAYATGEDFYLYREGLTPAVTKVMEAVDRERMTICETFGYKPIPVEESLYNWAHSAIFFSPVTPAYAGPFSLRDRFVEEDLGFGLVNWASTGDLVGVKTLTMKALIQIGSALNEFDYWEKGRRKADLLGLAGMSADEINRYLKTGEKP